MKRRLIKTASGTILHNSSPDAIEDLLVGEMKEALGKWKDAVEIKPFLQVDEDDGDLSGNVKNGYGAIQLDVYGVKIFIPFIIADKTLLPFDTIRMGEETVSYDLSKLQRLVNSIETKVKSDSSGEGDDQFQTMEVAKFDDIQANNGFLGTIMNIRDTHQAKDLRGETPWSGYGFGVADDERMERRANAEVDILSTFQETMEKIAQVAVYTPEQLNEFESHLRKKAEAEEEEALEKTAAAEDSMEEARVKRDMVKLSEEQLFNVHRAASGNDIAFPIFDNRLFEYRMGRVYRQFKSVVNNPQKNKVGALVIDSKGGYRVLRNNDPFMASTRTPGAFELPSQVSRGMVIGNAYTGEIDTSTLLMPFTVEDSFMNKIIRGQRGAVRYKTRMASSLFQDVFECKELIADRSAEGYAYGQYFTIIISKDPKITEPWFAKSADVSAYVVENAEDPEDIQMSNKMLHSHADTIVLPGEYKLFELKKNISGFYTRPDGLFKQGPMAKEAAYDNQNKATLSLKGQSAPKSFDLKWQFTSPKSMNGTEVTKIERRSVEGLSFDQTRSMLDKLGYDNRTQTKFFEIIKRNGRGATFDLPNPERAANVAAPDVADGKVKKKMQNLANSLLSSRNFMPAMEDAVSGALSGVIATTIPNSVNAAQDLSQSLGWKTAYETAVAMEKTATAIGGPGWHEVSALVNLKYRMDKIAQDVSEGNYLHNTDGVFEKIAELMPAISQKASELTRFNRDQLIKTSSYLVDPSLVKEAIHQLDVLYQYGTHGKKKDQFEKEAGLFRNLEKGLREQDQSIEAMSNVVKRLHDSYEHQNAGLRATMALSGDVESAMEGVKRSEGELHQAVANLGQKRQERSLLNEELSKKNLGVAAGVGLPGLVGLSYGYNEAKENQK